MTAQPLALYGHDLFGEVVKPKPSGALASRFEFPPFSVLDARSGEWQERKRAWMVMGMKGEVGRSVSGANCTSGRNTAMLEGAGEVVSIFDPVLCELAYRWFCPPGGQVVDPFAGGSVRGLVAGLLGLRYWGCDLRAEQIAANEAQRHIAPGAGIEWVCGDALEVVDHREAADFVFSCPPYGDLERYSDNPRDLSTHEYHTFLANYRRVILRCATALKPDRFACFVVGDFRDRKTGNYRGFVADTIAAFRDVRMELYNDAVLVTPCGSLPIRAGKQFDAGRKLGKTHQNVLVFVKGNPRAAARAAIEGA